MTYDKTQKIVGGGALLAIAVAALVMVGWVFDIALFKSVIPHYATMKFNTALLLLLVGVAMYFSYKDARRYKWPVVALTATIMLLGLLTLLQYLLSINLGIDELFITDSDTRLKGGQFPGRMAGSTAFSFMLLAMGLGAARSRYMRLRVAAQWSLHLAFVIALLAMIGYLYSVPSFYKLSFLSTMAVHTAVIFAVVSVAGTFINPELGLTGLLLGKKTGSIMARKLLPAGTLALILFGYIRILTHRYNLVSVEFGIALFGFSMMFVLVALVWLTAEELNDIEDAREVVERKQRNMEQTYNHVKIFVEEAPTSIAMFDKNICYIAASRRWREDYNLGDVDLTGKSHYTIFPEIGEDWKQIHRRCLAGEVDKQDDQHFVRADGSEQWISWEVRPWYAADNEVGGIVMHTTDVTERKKIEIKLAEAVERQKRILEELRQSEELFKNAFEFSSIGMAIVSPEGKWIDVNKRVSEIVGYSEQELINLTFQQITHPDDLEIDLAQVKRLLAGQGTNYQMEKRYIKKNGQLVWVLLSVSLVKGSNGEPSFFVSQIQDVTDRKKAQEDLLRVNTELKAILDSGNYVSIISTTPTGTITHFSKGAETLLGYTEEEMVGKQTPERIHLRSEVEEHGNYLTNKYGREIRGFDAFVELARQGGYESKEWTYIKKDGTHFPVQLVVTSIRDNAGNITGYLGIATDLTQRKEAEETMKRVTQLEAQNKEMEQFNYIASHDLQEPLRTVTNFTGLLEKKYADKLDDAGRKYLEYTRKSAERMSELIRELLFYSRLGKQKDVQVIDANEVVQNVLLDLSKAVEESGAVVTVQKMHSVTGYKTDIQQLFQNLISNALKFRKPGTPHNVSIGVEQKEGVNCFYIKDNGIGIKPTDVDKVFVLFKRLHDRADYEGTGIGLAHCKKIVELHNGKIWVESAPGEGSTFWFTLNTPDT